MIALPRCAASCIPAMRRLAVVVVILSAGIAPTIAKQEPSSSLEVAKNDFAKTQALATQLAALSPKVVPKDAKAVAAREYARANRLSNQYHMFDTSISNIFL